MTSNLANLRAQIKLYQDFIALCERIKQLEKLQGGQLEDRISRLERQRSEILVQLASTEEEHQRLSASIESADRAISLFEQAQVEQLIQLALIRLRFLQKCANDTTLEIERSSVEMHSNAVLLDQLYSQLDERIRVDGFDPSTASEILANLVHQKDVLSNALKAEITSQRTQLTDIKAPPVMAQESEFFPALIADISHAKRSIEIISPYLGVGRAGEVLSELAKQAANGLKVMIYTRPIDEQNDSSRLQAQRTVADAHRLMLTVVQRSGLEYNAAIIDGIISWEGDINILGANNHAASMRRNATSSHVRELRRFILP